MADENTPREYDPLIAAIDDLIEQFSVETKAVQTELISLDTKRATLGHHPNTIAYSHGGLLTAHGGGVGHILSHIGFYRLSWPQAIQMLADARTSIDTDCLLTALVTVCESNPTLEIEGLSWLDDQGLLRRGEMNPFWVKRPKLGLGQPAKCHGLKVIDTNAHRGLYTLHPCELHDSFADVAPAKSATFGDLLPLVIDAGRAQLGQHGAEALHQEAADRYWADCARFEAHQRRNDDRRWRWKAPLSRQGHHAVTISKLNSIPLPAGRTRGHAANWLHDNGANPRFRKGDPK